MLGLGWFPAAHAHKLISGKTLVHSHLIADPVEHAGTLDHGDHHGVQTLVPSFTIERILQVAVPVVLSAVVLVLPETRPLSRVNALDAPVIHGPPLRVQSLRAPPA